MNHQKTIFITGANGFIGKNIREYFHNKAILLTPRHSQLDLSSQEDVNKFFKEHEIDYVIHCANIGGNRKSIESKDNIEKNIRMFFNLAENSRYFDKMIHLGSGAEYDKSRPLKKISEISFGERIPLDDYGFSKYVVSKFIEKSENIICLRLFGVFGKYEDYEYKFISNAIVKNIFQIPIRIRQNAYFDWVYINDLLEIIPNFLNHNSVYKVYNITPSIRTDLFTIAQTVNFCSSIPSDIIIDATGLNNEYTGNNSRLMDHLRHFQFTPMSTAISELTSYYNAFSNTLNPDIIKKDEYIQKCKINQR